MMGVENRLLWIYNHKPIFDSLGVDLFSHYAFSELLEEFYEVVWAVESKEECIILAVEYNHNQWMKSREKSIHFPALDLSPLYIPEEKAEEAAE